MGMTLWLIMDGYTYVTIIILVVFAWLFLSLHHIVFLMWEASVFVARIQTIEGVHADLWKKFY